MARARVDDEPQVRLYVISSGWPYKPTHSPLGAKLVLYGATSPRRVEETSTNGRVVSNGACCVEHAEMAQALLREEHDCLFVVDCSEIADCSAWQAELLRPGRARRMLERWFAKFNCKDATVIAFAQDAALWAPLAQLHGEQRISRVVHFPGLELEELHSAKVETVEAESKPGWQDVVHAATGQDASNLHLEDLYFTAVDFDVHRRSKQLVQNAHDITSFILDMATTARSAETSASAAPRTAAEVASPAPAAPVPAEVVAMLRETWEVKTLATFASCVTADCLTPGMNFTCLRVNVLAVQTEEEVLRATCADCHSSVDVIAPLTARALVKGGNVSISGSTISLEGRLFVLLRHIESSSASALREGYSVEGSAGRDVSRWRRCFGCLVLRGKKCVLARDADKNLRIPIEEAALRETAEQAAQRAVAEACDIYPEEFFVLRDVPPAVYYEDGTVVTIFAALATNPPPPGTSEEEDLLDEDDLYDWFRYDSASARLPLQQRRVLARLSSDVESAVTAGVVVSDYPCQFASDIVEAPPEGPSDGNRRNGYRGDDAFNWRRAKNCRC